jgi:hypothetical protein
LASSELTSDKLLQAARTLRRPRSHIAKRVEGVNPTESFRDSSQRCGSTINGAVRQMKEGVRITRTTLDNARSGAPECLVPLHRVVKLFDAACRQQFCQGYRVFYRKVRALPMMWKHAMSGVTQQHNATALPGSQWPHCEQTPAKTVRDCAYHLGNGWMPTGESRDSLVMRDRRNPIIVHPGRWPFDNGKEIDVQS